MTTNMTAWSSKPLVRQDIRLMYRTLRQRMAEHENTGTLTAELGALSLEFCSAAKEAQA